jgi:hypothetical protein
LFDRSVIITEFADSENKNMDPNFLLKSHFRVNIMSLETNVRDEPLRFVLKSRWVRANQKWHFVQIDLYTLFHYASSRLAYPSPLRDWQKIFQY